MCVTGDRGDGSEMYTLNLTSINVTTQGIAYMVLEHWILANIAHHIYTKLLPHNAIIFVSNEVMVNILPH